MRHLVLEYDDEDFAPTAVICLRARQPILVAVRGPACALLRPRIRQGEFIDPARLVLVPKLRSLIGVVQFGWGYGMPVLCEEHEDMIGVRIGVPRAPVETPSMALRLIVQGSRSVATEAWERVAVAVEGLVAVDSVTIGPYPNSANIHEISSALHSLHDALDHVYEATERRLGFGWTEYMKAPFGRWIVWKRKDGTTFVAPAVEWAHLELIRAWPSP
jgi:hypothetical protein